MFHGAGTTALMVVALFSGSASATPVNADPAIPGCTQLILTPSMHSAPLSGIPSSAPVSIAVYANSGCSWDVVVPGAYSWIHVVPNHGTGAGNLHFSVDASPTTRTGYIHVLAGNIHRIVTVNQGTSPPGTCTVATVPQTGSQLTPLAHGGGGTVSVTTGTTCSWSAEVTGADSGWLTLTGASGIGPDPFQWSASTNQSTSPRTATITAHTANGSSTLTVTQVGACPMATVPATGSTVNEAAAGGTGSISVATGPTCQWSAVSSDTSWLHVEAGHSQGTGDGHTTWTADPNTSAERTASITLTATDGSSVVHVNQASGAPGSCTIVTQPPSGTQEQPAWDGGTGTIGVSTGATCDWTAAVTYQSGAGWLSLSATSGTGHGSTTWTASENGGSDRAATIKVSNDDGSASTVTVAQAGECSIVTTPGTGTTLLPPAAGSLSSPIIVTTGEACAWSAAVAYDSGSGSGWLTLSATGGTGDGSTDWSTTANTGTTERTATITVENSGGTSVSTLTVSQAAPSATCPLTTDPANGAPLMVPAEGLKNQTITMTTGGGCTWAARVTYDPGSGSGWVTLSQASGSATAAGLAHTDWTALPNTGAIQRTATIRVTTHDGSSSIHVTQSAPGPVDCTTTTDPVDGTVLCRNSASDLYFIDVSPYHATCQWTATATSDLDHPWLTFPGQATAYNGTGFGPIPVIISANAGQGAVFRTGTIEVSYDDSVVSTVTINQTGRVVLGSLATFAATSAPDQSLAVTTDDQSCTWTLTSDQLWLKLPSSQTTLGAGSESVSVHADDNTGSFRTAVLTLTEQTADGLSVCFESEVTVSQDAAATADPCTVLTAPRDGSTIEQPALAGFGEIAVWATVASGSCAWSATSDSAWLSLAPASGGAGNAQVIWTATANTGAARVATVKFYSGPSSTAQSTVRVNQASGVPAGRCEGSPIAVVNPTGAVPVISDGAAGAVIVLTGELCGWSAEVTSLDSAWLTLASASGTGNGVVMWTAAANTTSDRRSAMISAKQDDGSQASASVTLTQNGNGVLCSASVSVGITGDFAPSSTNLKLEFTVSQALQTRLGSDWDQKLFLNTYTDGGTGWPVLIKGGCCYLTASDPSGNLIPANRYGSAGTNFLSASFPLHDLKADSGAYYLVTNATVDITKFPTGTAWASGNQPCDSGNPQECINSGQLLISLYRGLDSQTNTSVTCNTNAQSPNCPDPACFTALWQGTAGQGQLPSDDTTGWCGSDEPNNPMCTQSPGQTWWNCDQLTPQATVEFTWPANTLANSLSGDVTYIGGMGLPIQWTNVNCGDHPGPIVGQLAQDGVLGYWADPVNGAAGTGFATGWWTEDGVAVSPAVKAYPADVWSSLSSYLGGLATGSPVATLNSFTATDCTWNTASFSWRYAGIVTTICGWCGLGSQTNPPMPADFNEPMTWDFTAKWVTVADAPNHPWWTALEAAEDTSATPITGTSPQQYFYPSYIVAEQAGFVVCEGKLYTNDGVDRFPNTSGEFYLVMPYGQNLATGSQISSPNPKYVVIMQTDTDYQLASACSAQPSHCGEPDTSTHSGGKYWHRYWANGSDPSATGDITGDLANSIIWGLFGNQTDIGTRPVGDADWSSCTPLAPTQFFELSMGEYYAILSSLNAATGIAAQVPRWVGSGLWTGQEPTPIYSSYLDTWVAKRFTETGIPYADGYFTSYQDRLKGGPIGNASQNPSLDAASPPGAQNFGYIEFTVMDPWTVVQAPPPMGDIDGSGCTDAEDIALMLSVWGPVEQDHPADLTDDGLVDSRDIPKILEGFGNGCPP